MSNSAISAEQLIEAIEDAGYDARSYSGRAMFGAQCVGVDLGSESDLWALACDLTEQGLSVTIPRTDSLGRGIIAYWPSFKWPAQNGGEA